MRPGRLLSEHLFCTDQADRISTWVKSAVPPRCLRAQQTQQKQQQQLNVVIKFRRGSVPWDAWFCGRGCALEASVCMADVLRPPSPPSCNTTPTSIHEGGMGCSSRQASSRRRCCDVLRAVSVHARSALLLVWTLRKGDQLDLDELDNGQSGPGHKVKLTEEAWYRLRRVGKFPDTVDRWLGCIATVYYHGALLLFPEVAPDVSSAEVDQPLRLRNESRPDHYKRSTGGVHAGVW